MRGIGFRYFLLLAFLTCGVFAGETVRPSRVDSTFWAWKPAPAQGEPIDLQSFRGRYVLLNFWGEWCQKCREEIPFLAKLRRRYGDDRLVILGLLKPDDLKRAQAFMREKSMNWPQVLLDERRQTYFAVQKFPTNLLISPEGKIVMDGFSGHYRDFVRRLAGTDSLQIR